MEIYSIGEAWKNARDVQKVWIPKIQSEPACRSTVFQKNDNAITSLAASCTGLAYLLQCGVRGKSYNRLMMDGGH